VKHVFWQVLVCTNLFVHTSGHTQKKGVPKDASFSVQSTTKEKIFFNPRAPQMDPEDLLRAAQNQYKWNSL
jgi:hypothetical protein